MLLSQGRYWRVSLAKSAGQVELGLLRDNLGEELKELREFHVAVPLGKWNRLLKQVKADRKLLGGVLLDFALPKEQLSIVVGNDRLFSELQRVLVEATVSLIESGALALSLVDVGAD